MKGVFASIAALMVASYVALLFFTAYADLAYVYHQWGTGWTVAGLVLLPATALFVPVHAWIAGNHTPGICTLVLLAVSVAGPLMKATGILKASE